MKAAYSHRERALPSWQDLAAQLGVARGTVRSAYEKLSAAQLIVASRATGTHVADRPRAIVQQEQPPDPGSFMAMYQEMTQGPAMFQMGVPAAEIFPATLFARIRAPCRAAPKRAQHRSTRTLAVSLNYGGNRCLSRRCPWHRMFALAGHHHRGVQQRPRTGVTRAWPRGQKAWIEDPGFPFTRPGPRARKIIRLRLYRSTPAASTSTMELRRAPDAKLVVVTPGQQAPLGVTLSLERRLRLLDWAAQESAWVIEDDYLSELQLKGRAAPALASLDRGGRVIHIGSFSKTISPTLRLGFLVAPISLMSRFAEGRGVPCAAARAVRAAYDGRVHARRSLPAPSSAHQACLLRSA